MGVCGIILLEIHILIASLPIAYHLILIPIIVLFSDAFVEREEIFNFNQKKVNFVWLTAYLLSLAIVVYQLSTVGFVYEYLQFLTIPVMICIAYLLYFSGLLYGGGDAKALMSIAILMPVYPINSAETGTLISVLFPFALVVLLNAVIITAFLPVAFAVYNLCKGDFKFPVALLGYKINLTELPKKYVWLMERIQNGKLKYTLTDYKRKVSASEYNMLKKMGVEKVWVTPQIPFILPMTIGFIMGIFAGNILFRIITFFTGW